MSDRTYRFAEFELIVSEGELRTANSSIRLQQKPLLLLVELLEQPQRVVTREQLRKRMWGNETFVDYEQGINVAIKKVRDSLGDSTENPRLVETVAKRGYRFLVPVDKVEREAKEDVEPEAGATQPTAQGATLHFEGRSRSWALAVLATVVLGIFGLLLFQFLAPGRHSAQIHSIAVLPLRNLSPDSSQDYFADGITEELITNLAQSLPLRVISRTSVMRYKQTSEPISQVARELGVEAIVEGSVSKAGDRVSVTVQLIDAREDRHLWAQRFDRTVGDLLDVEEQVSREIGSQIGSTLASGYQVRTATHHPVDPQVYELCLLGRYHWNRRTAAGLHKSIEYFQQAISLDANYAPAYAGLANAYVILPSYDSVQIEDSDMKAAEAAHHALALDDGVAEAHATLGMIAVHHWVLHSEEGDREFQRALQLNPNYATAHHWYAFARLFSDKRSEALTQIDLARQLDPLSAIINADEGHFLYAAERYPEAEARLHQAIELAPDLGQPHETLALIDLAEGRKVDATAEARTGLALDSNNPRTMGEAGYVLAATGHSREARRLLSSLENRIRRGAAPPMLGALIYIGLGDRTEALNIMEKVAASTNNSGPYVWSQWQPVLDQLHFEARYQRLAAKMEP